MESKHSKKVVNNENINSNSKRKQKKKKKKIGRYILLAILLIIIIVAGFITYRTLKNGGGLQGFLATMVGHDENTKKSLLPIEFLLLGESGGLSDTIMICSYNPNTQEASMVSVPRDTFVGKNEKKAVASDKINSIYNRTRDPQKTLAAVNDVTGLNLKNYVLIDTKALRQLVDAIGGVEFDVPIDMNYEDTSEENYLLIHLEKGLQRIDGNKAEQLVRFRHNEDGSTYPASYGEQDIGRMRTQREFISAVLKQTLTPGNIFKLGEFIDIAHQNVKTNISLSLAKDYIPYAVDFNTENLKTGSLPGESVKPASVYVYLLEPAGTQKMINEFFFGGPTSEETLEETATTVQILNGSNNSENLKKVVDKIKELGYTVVKVGNTTVTSKTSITNRTNAPEEKSASIKQTLGVGTVESGKDNTDADFTIVIGKDYK